MAGEGDTATTAGGRAVCEGRTPVEGKLAAKSHLVKSEMAT